MSRREAYVRLNIVLLPDARVREQAIGLSQQVSETVPTAFVLGTRTNIPHNTVYQAAFPERQVDNVRNEVGEVAAHTEPFAVTTDAFTIAYAHFLYWKLKRSIALMELHQSVLVKSNPLREGYIRPNLLTFPNQTERDAFEIQNYGALLTGERYTPHLTLTYLRDSNNGEQALSVVRRAQSDVLSFEASGLALAPSGNHGTIHEPVEIFPFSG